MSRAKFITIQFEIPVNSIKKDDGLFSVKKVGDLLVMGRARIEPEATEEKGITVTISAVDYLGVDILPILQLPDCKIMLASIHKAALKNVNAILQQ